MEAVWEGYGVDAPYWRFDQLMDTGVRDADED
jgi:hypothetical protein